MSNYNLERIVPSQWRNYKLIRIEALKTTPELFGSTYEKEASYREEDGRIMMLQKQQIKNLVLNTHILRTPFGQMVMWQKN